MTSFAPRRRTGLALAVVLSLSAVSSMASEDAAPPSESATVSPEAQAVLDRMTSYLRSLSAFSVSADSSRDEVVARGYKLQNNEHSELVVQRPNKLRAEIDGDLRRRIIVYDGAKLAMYSPADEAYVVAPAPDTLAVLVESLAGAGVEMPLMDVLYQGATGTLADGVFGGVLVGRSRVDGVECDHLAFREATVDWQLWVETGARPLPRRIVITTRYEVGDPQYEATLRWNLAPHITSATFAFEPPKGSAEVEFSNAVRRDGTAP